MFPFASCRGMKLSGGMSTRGMTWRSWSVVVRNGPNRRRVWMEVRLRHSQAMRANGGQSEIHQEKRKLLASQRRVRARCRRRMQHQGLHDSLLRFGLALQDADAIEGDLRKCSIALVSRTRKESSPLAHLAQASAWPVSMKKDLVEYPSAALLRIPSDASHLSLVQGRDLVYPAPPPVQCHSTHPRLLRVFHPSQAHCAGGKHPDGA